LHRRLNKKNADQLASILPARWEVIRGSTFITHISITSLK
jgi:hypothetical protein